MRIATSVSIGFSLVPLNVSDGDNLFALDTGNPTGNYEQGEPHPIGNSSSMLSKQS